MAPRLASVTTVLLALAFAGSARGAELVPDPALDPPDLLWLQVQALAWNGADDAGIALTFRFASPDNRRETGPLDRFVAMVKGPIYRPMLNHTRATYEPVESNGDVARQVVSVRGGGGAWVTYTFVLRRQELAPYEGCWMTEAVLRLEDGGLRHASSGSAPAASSRADGHAVADWLDAARPLPGCRPLPQRT